MALFGQLDLNDLVIFMAVAESGGFTKAANRLGVATAKVSVEVSRLESRLGISLFSRSTRKVVLTDVGQKFYEECQPLLNSLDEAIGRARSGEKELAGNLRISTTVDHATALLVPALAEFAKQNPNLTIDLRTTDRVVNMLDEGTDVSIRIGWLRDSSMRATKLGEFDQYVAASPEYAKKFKKISVPDDLLLMNWISLGLLSTPLTWKFSKGEDTHVVHIKSRARVDSVGVMRALAEQGVGVAVFDQFTAQQGINMKSLVRFLPDWSLPSGGIYAVYPPGQHIQTKVRHFIKFYKSYLDETNFGGLR